MPHRDGRDLSRPVRVAPYHDAARHQGRFPEGQGQDHWADDEKLAERIKKQFPDQYDVLVKTLHTPIAKALSSLSVADLRKLGCQVEETGDTVYIKAADTAIDKLVNKLLGEGSQPDAE